MDKVNIKKGNIKNCVTRQQFEMIYKPNGWILDEEEHKEKTIVDEIESKGIKSEEQQVAYANAKKSRAKMKFNDNLFKGE